MHLTGTYGYITFIWLSFRHEAYMFWLQGALKNALGLISFPAEYTVHL